MSGISTKEVEHIAGLARIKLTEREKEKMTKELGAILGYIDKLKEVNTEGVDPVRSRSPQGGRSRASGGAASNGVEPIAHITGLTDVFRKDDNPREPDSENIKRLLEQAPSEKGGYVKVKSVFED